MDELTPVEKVELAATVYVALAKVDPGPIADVIYEDVVKMAGRAPDLGVESAALLAEVGCFSMPM